MMRAVPLAATLLLLMTVPNALVGEVQGQDQLPAASRKAREEFLRSGFHWMTPQQYKDIDKSKNTKPFIFTWVAGFCPVCRGFLQGLATKQDPVFLSSISAQFHAVMIFDDYGQELVEEYQTQGYSYVPRTVFADPDGKPRFEVHTKLGEQYPWFFLEPQLLWQMRQTLQELQNKTGTAASDLDMDWPS